jgi:hypothetical protein
MIGEEEGYPKEEGGTCGCIATVIGLFVVAALILAVWFMTKTS